MGLCPAPVENKSLKPSALPYSRRCRAILASGRTGKKMHGRVATGLQQLKTSLLAASSKIMHKKAQKSTTSLQKNGANPIKWGDRPAQIGVFELLSRYW
jgi:hypothetical protein